MIDKNLTYAIVGASNNEEKYGYKVLKNLFEAGFNVIPINSREKVILGLKTYQNITDLDKKIDVVVFVVPPVVTEKILDEVINLEIKNVWMQPGSESEVAIKKCQDNKINFIQNACIIVNN
jgi:predicted CoA-binding protein